MNYMKNMDIYTLLIKINLFEQRVLEKINLFYMQNKYLKYGISNSKIIGSNLNHIQVISHRFIRIGALDTAHISTPISRYSSYISTPIYWCSFFK